MGASEDAAEAGEWEELATDDGHKYWFNEKTQESVWHQPEAHKRGLLKLKTKLKGGFGKQSQSQAKPPAELVENASFLRCLARHPPLEVDQRPIRRCCRPPACAHPKEAEAEQCETGGQRHHTADEQPPQAACRF